LMLSSSFFSNCKRRSWTFRLIVVSLFYSLVTNDIDNDKLGFQLLFVLGFFPQLQKMTMSLSTRYRFLHFFLSCRKWQWTTRFIIISWFFP
jgi:hypothetical protein